MTRIELSEELVERGMVTLNYKEALREAIQVAAKEYAAANAEALVLWAEVYKECAEKGIVIAADEVITFDFTENIYKIQKTIK